MPAVFAGRFLMECLVAVGPSSMVWKAREIAGGGHVALKLFPIEAIQDAASLAEAQRIVGAARACSNPAVVPTTEILIGETQGAFVTPWVEGPTLRRVLESRSARYYTVQEAGRWFVRLLDALEAAHACGLVHGALNPDVIIQEGGETRVVGFGVNAWLHRALGRSGRVGPREPGYACLSPARHRGDPASVGDDIFAFGVLAYLLLTGAPPRRRWWRQAPDTLTWQRGSRGAAAGKISFEWERAIRQCLAVRERDRVQTVRALRLRLELGPGREPATRPAIPPVVVPKPAAPPVQNAARQEVPEKEVQPPLPMARPPEPAFPQVAAPAQPDRAQPAPVAIVANTVPHPVAKPAAAAPARPPVPPEVAAPAQREVRPAVKGVTMLRSTLGVVAVLTVGVGALLTWQVVDREGMDRALGPGIKAAKEAGGELAHALSGGDSESEDEPDESSLQGDSVPVTQAIPGAPTSSPARGAAVATVERGEGSATEGKDARPDPATAPLPEAAVAARVPTHPRNVQEADTEARHLAASGEVAGETTWRMADELALVPAAGSPLNAGIFELDGVEVPPRLIERTEPALSGESTWGAGPHQVELVVVIDRMGRVASASVHSTTAEPLVGPTLKAARLWRFSPASIRGQAVAVRVGIPLVFLRE